MLKNLFSLVYYLLILACQGVRSAPLLCEKSRGANRHPWLTNMIICSLVSDVELPSIAIRACFTCNARLFYIDLLILNHLEFTLLHCT